ncbi:cation:proton antiporter [Aeromicrobium sp. CFBP 8757]|uniref:cation:proton antiporter n=1 Tax=Aeromicrobium sp. CFBP 8757 TaxID=2775288 RepID=UPI001783410B|nr:cation:proton antiporter [Aeromicrobium sp. CFBP 8757]MBD8607148.1 cation:proton antiporter [Aeromicrobium sp. CFBP 8757]
MDLTILGVLALTVIVAASVLAPKVGVAAPLVLVGAGVLLALVPGVPRIEPEPELILAGVLPPLLYAASVNMPAMDFRRDLKSIGWLSIVVVVSSALAIGWVVETFVPGLGFAEGVALGAIVSPTDAVATSIVKRTGVAPRLVTVLEGESMINDASALVLLRSAVAATGVSVSVLDVSVDFVVAIAVAAVVGLVVGAASVAVRARLHDATVNTAISFAVPFIAYAPAEHLGASGLVAVVTTGLVTGYWGPSVLRAQDRLAEAVNWRTVAFLLEGGVFLLMGLELGPLLDDFRSEDGDFGRLAVLSALCLGILLAVRGLYVVALLWSLLQDRKDMHRWEPRMNRVRDYLASDESNDLSDRRLQRIHLMVARREADMRFYEEERLDRRAGVILVWAGMRGSVTLAAAQTLPTGFEQRELLILVAFTVAVTSLLVQGGTLAWVVRRLEVESDRREIDRQQLAALSQMLADVAASRCAEVADDGLDGRVLEPVVLDQVQDDSHPERTTRWAGEGDDGVAQRLRDYVELRRAVLADQRDALIDARSSGRFDSENLNRMLRRVDAGDMAMDRLD